ncbi:TRAP transporter substrate-binding protein [Candidatus Methylospira mobilis]|uniref:TRAP transporter substrate-binding protein n=1 Tax=Candidatus Methylospira mobilis TaxID=1808979 RepID=A0A5Q0BCK4_9GAMM|nr:TAXI family TRAP transporter solute-binding subunit [Candidatus Methylospira mobilis]QFY41530.1 TRAP transporter substrate-binding protein [Candidatus Methylospira mobilis]WNV05232.1 TAXI family TRAP transporter solute-binding subunit [Candidatus Methylospira mobilis]
MLPAPAQQAATAFCIRETANFMKRFIMNNTTKYVLEYSIAIYETVREAIVSWMQTIRDIWPMLLLLISGIALVIWLAKPAPPNHVYLATGLPNGGFSSIGKEYVEFFRKNGITLELIASNDGKQNLEFLKNKHDKVQSAFMHSGIATSSESAGLLSLGSVNYEPLWFFYRGPDTPDAEQRIGVLVGGKISIGQEGSGTRIQAQRILELNGYQPTASNILSLSPNEAAAALKRGDIDGMFVINSIDSPLIQALLHDPTLRLISFTRANAYARQMNYISVLEVPMGGFDLSRNFPQRDTKLLATTPSLVVEADLHPAIQRLFLQAVRAINGRGDYFSKVNEFPVYRDASIPESPVSIRYHKSGLPFLNNYLSFWIAEFIDRLVIMIVPFVAFAYPIISKLPGYRIKRMRTRLGKNYKKLKLLEIEIVNNYNREAHEEYQQCLNDIEQNILETQTPSSLSEFYLLMLMHVDFVRSRLAKKHS